MIPFSITDSLPDGPMLLEASVGTGEIWTVVSLVTCHIAEAGVGTGELLLITLSSVAVVELRGQVRSRIISVANDLRILLVGGPEPMDPVSWLLGTDRHVQCCRERLQAALDHFGTATIITVHSFCQRQSEGLGVLGDWGGADEMIADISIPMREYTTDEYLASYPYHPDPPLGVRRVLLIAATAVSSRLPFVLVNQKLSDFQEQVRVRFAARRYVLGPVSFGDLLDGLRPLVIDSPVAEQVCVGFRRRFPMVLVDELQDADPNQWTILRRTFVDADMMITLTGNPKQSIYDFRNADLGFYLEATQVVRHRATLETNHRSELGVATGVMNLFGDFCPGDSDIQITPVHPTRSSGEEASVLDATPAAHIQLCGYGPEATENPERVVMGDAVAYVRALLAGAWFRSGGGKQPIGPRDITILTRTHDRGLALVSELCTTELSATWHGPGSALNSPAVADWLTVLTVVAQPTCVHIPQATLGELLDLLAINLLVERDETPAS